MCACGCDKRAGWRQCCDSFNIRRLYEVYANNGLPYEENEHMTLLVVARNEEEAVNSIKNYDDCYFYDYEEARFQVRELYIVDGYKIKLEKI